MRLGGEFVLLIFISVLLIILVYCELGLDEPRDISRSLTVNTGVVIDSCEYVYVGYSDHFGGLTHKGNCKNHR